MREKDSDRLVGMLRRAGFSSVVKVERIHLGWPDMAWARRAQGAWCWWALDAAGRDVTGSADRMRDCVRRGIVVGETEIHARGDRCES